MNTVNSPYQKIAEAPLVCLLGGVAYYALELLWRGFSHWSMAICGGICFWMLYRINARYCHTSLILRALMGCVVITLTELLAGCLLNLGLGLAVWDYSNMPFQFLGQICLWYSIVWFFLCFPISGISYLIRRHVFYADA